VTALPIAPIPTPPPGAPARTVTITPPGSKSITNRALLLAALADGTSTLTRPLLDADDAQRTLTALTALGARFTLDADTLHVHGVAGRWKTPDNAPLRLDLGNAGTATRFLAAAAALATPGSPGVVIDGNARMRERPIAELATALNHLGIRTTFQATPGFPPLLVHPADRAALAHHATFGRTASSQFISALLLIAPWLPNGLTVTLPDNPADLTSASYIRMTTRLLDSLGAPVSGHPPDSRTLTIAPRPIPPFHLTIEPDASGATYFWAAAALLPALAVTIPLAAASSLQSDAAFPDLLARMGATLTRTTTSTTVAAPPAGAPLRSIDADLADMPDAAMTLAAVACFTDPTIGPTPGPTTLRGLRTLRVKETDRLAATATELTKVGARVEIVTTNHDEALVITPPPPGWCHPSAPPVAFDTYDDHRMAMSLALIALRRPNVTINNPACVAKTYPTYFDDLAKLR
jgi:3-phosphoshikimate 1-carboxyvinyltransferase